MKAAERFLQKAEKVFRARFGPERTERFFGRNRKVLLERVQWYLVRKGKVKADDTPPELWTEAKRAKANLAAMRVLASRKSSQAPFTDDEINKLLLYSGWGGLSIDKYKSRFPKGLVPDPYGLINEYYTPTALTDEVARVVTPLLDEIKDRSGRIQALEPSAGIGRFIRSFRRLGAPVDWIAVELSQISAAISAALYADEDIFYGPFEEWAHRNAASMFGRVQLVCSNPPYGQRGRYAQLDPNPEYKKQTRADAYFMRRSLDLLAPRGIGVFLVPAGTMSGQSDARRALRVELLRRNHLMAAYRLPSTLFPGANLVTDLIFWRSRGGVRLVKLDEADEYVAEGSYFARHRDHILGTERGDPNARDRFNRYSIDGDFEGLPELVERKMCKLCVSTPYVVEQVSRRESVARTRDVDTVGLSPVLEAAALLGARVSEYLREASAGTRAPELQEELLSDLRDLSGSSWLIDNGGAANPWKWKDLVSVADAGNWAAQQYLNAFTKAGKLADAITRAPDVARGLNFDADDVIGQARYLYRTKRHLHLPTLAAFHEAQGGQLSSEALEKRLLAASWCWDGTETASKERLTPKEDYVTGDLWRRFEIVAEHLGDDPQWQRQHNWLNEAINPASWAEINDPQPSQGWIPIEVVEEWVTLLNRAPVVLTREGTWYRADGLRSSEAKLAIGWINHHDAEFRPTSMPPQSYRNRYDGPALKGGRDRPSINELRPRWRAYFEDHFAEWLTEDETRRSSIETAYNEKFRGYVDRKFSSEPLDVARWGDAFVPHAHQNAGARRVLERRGGLVAFDVGVGKTLTGLLILARARQEGWARRPVVVVPGSLAWKWFEDFQKALPDYKVTVIGSQRYESTRGTHVKEARRRLGAGEITLEQYKNIITTSKTDSPTEQAAKWLRFAAGAYDAVIVTREAFPRTRLDENELVAYCDAQSAIQRSIKLTQERLSKRKRSDLTERQRAILDEGTRAWVQEQIELPKGQKYVPGVLWSDLGVDLLLVDEAADYKNLHMAQPRDGGIPKFMGSGKSSKRSWAMDFRAHTVRRRTGGGGVILLTATPAKNSPLEFYNLLQYVDPAAWTGRGIYDPEQFVDRYIKITTREVLDSKLDLAYRPVVVGFRNLPELREAIFRYSDFKTADDVELKLPEARMAEVYVPLGPLQEAKYLAGLDTIEGEITSTKRTNQNKILGVQARLAAVALHPQLDEGYTWDTALDGGEATRKADDRAAEFYISEGWEAVSESAGRVTLRKTLPRPVYASPKLRRIAQQVAAATTCGHIIFCEPTAPHVWMREVLVEHGIPRDRIAILNAKATKKTIDRQKIAKGFNGDASTGTPPLYDVVIANSVAYEGLDLQVRTCMIHHADLPWTPSDLIQRNGRGLRQGNTEKVLDVLYYMSDKSMDGLRYAMIQGKANWLFSFLRSKKAEISNPAAKNVDYLEMLIKLSRNPEKTRKAIEKKREEREAAQRENLRKKTFGRLKQANRLLEAARTEDDAAKAEALRKSGEEALEVVLGADTEVWRWRELSRRVRDHKLILRTADEAPLYEGLRLHRGSRRSAFGGTEQLSVEIGKQVVEPETGTTQVAFRRAGRGRWFPTDPADSRIAAADGEFPWDTTTPWPVDDDEGTRKEIENDLASLRRRSWVKIRWREFMWWGATDEFVAKWWPTIAGEIRRHLNPRSVLPVIIDERLVLVTGENLLDGVLIPPTVAGWRRFVKLAVENKDLKHAALAEVSREWFFRTLKRTFRTEAAGGATVVRRLAGGVPSELPDRATARTVKSRLNEMTVGGEPVALYQTMVSRTSDDAWSVGGTERTLDEAIRRVVAGAVVRTGYIELRMTSEAAEKLRNSVEASEAGPDYPTERGRFLEVVDARREDGETALLRLPVGLLEYAVQALRHVSESNGSASYLLAAIEARDTVTAEAEAEAPTEPPTAAPEPETATTQDPAVSEPSTKAPKLEPEPEATPEPPSSPSSEDDTRAPTPDVEKDRRLIERIAAALAKAKREAAVA